MKKLLFLLGSQKGFEVLEEVHTKNPGNIKLVTTFREIDVMESYTKKIELYCKENKIKFIKWFNLKNTFVKYIEDNEIDAILTVSWKYLIPTDVIEYLNNNVFVLHDSILPKYRGFSPTPTAVMMGEKEIGVSIIRAVEGMDEGDIVVQQSTDINDSMYMQEIINLQSKNSKEAVISFLKLYNNDLLTYTKQDNSFATYSIWRNIKDMEIDWSKSSQNIYNMIRSLGPPYLGSYSFINGAKIYIWKSEVVKDLNFIDRHSGKIWAIDFDQNPIVICGEGMIKLTEVTNENGDKFKFDKIRVRLGNYHA